MILLICDQEKVGKRIKELERIYGIKEGRPEKLPNYSVVKSQSDLATQMGISVDTLQNYKLLAEMIPEIKNNWTICPVLDFSM